MKIKNIAVLIIPIISFLFVGWGGTGHTLINSHAANYFPKEMSEFTSWNSTLSSHASDADNRKDSDPTEAPKHYIDIDYYQEFKTTGAIPHDINVLISKYTQATVIAQGILPWTIIDTKDTLTACFKRRNFSKAALVAADLGHYVGDGHQPLHVALNYDGKLTNQSGIHSRYESTMLDKYSTSIIFSPDTAKYVSNVTDYVFSFIYETNSYVDSVLSADLIAKAAAGGSTKSAKYTDTLWAHCKYFTNKVINEASKRLASLIYTSWVDAGKPSQTVTVIDNSKKAITSYELSQNYPNPFNPSTIIEYSVPEISGYSHVELKIYDVMGKEVRTLVNENKTPGKYSITFNAGNSLSNGAYFYRLIAGSTILSRKLLLLK